MKRMLLIIIFALLTVSLFAQASPRKSISGKKVTVRTHQRHRMTVRKHVQKRVARPAVTAVPLPRSSPLRGTLLAQAGVSQYALLGNLNLAPTTPELTAVDPFANGLTPTNPLKPPRPFWYSVDKNGLTIMGLRTETTGALMVGGPPIDVVENQVVGFVPWPDAIPITQPDGEVPTDPAIVADHDKFAWRAEVGGVWEPVGITVSYPTDEALASNSETPPTFVYVVMKHSGHEWQSDPNPPAGRDPYLRDMIVSQPDLAQDGSLLVQVDVSQPNYPVDLFPTGPPIGSGLLGRNAGQPTFDPASDSVYVGNMPTLSLPTTPQVPNDLTSFVSVATLAPGELPVPGEVPSPVVVTVLCGPEHPDYPILAGVPQAWACIAEGGEGPFQWTFTNLPPWLSAHVDPITGQGDGILYGTPTDGTWTFQAHVDDYATTPPGAGDATVSLIITSDPATEYEYGELEWEVGAPAAVAIEGTPIGGGDPCALVITSSPGSLVPAWVDVKQIPGRTINNTALGGPVENTIGCVVMGTPPISGERYEFQMPNLQFPWPSQNLPILISGQVAGPYMFDPLPTGVGLSGLAWHEIDKIHDASTEADLLNREFFGVEPSTGQMYRVVPAYAGLETEGTIVPPPALEGELDEVETFAEVLTPLKTARPDIAALLDANPNLRVHFGDVAVEANPDPNVFVTALEIFDTAGVEPTIAIGGAPGSSVPIGALLKVSGVRGAEDPEEATLAGINAIALPGVQAYSLGLNSDLIPAVRGTDPGQIDYGILFVTGTTTGNVSVVDTAAAKSTQLLAVPGATALGGTAFYPTTGLAYSSGKWLQSVVLIGPGTPTPVAPVIWNGSAVTFTVGFQGSFSVLATGSPTPALSSSGSLPSGVTFTDQGDGSALLTGIPDVGTEGTYPLTITAANAVSPDATQTFTLTVNSKPAVTTEPSNQTVTAGEAATFTAAATGSPTPTAQWQLSTDSGATWSNIAGATNASYTTDATTAAMNSYQYRAVFTNSAGSATSIAVTLTVYSGPAVTMQPSNQTVISGQTATFAAAATGNPTPTVQWQLSTDSGATWSDISGAVSSSYTTAVTTTAMKGYQYRAVFTNTITSTTSAAATLMVNASVEMITPVPGSTLAGSTVTFTWSPDASVSSYWLWIGTAPGTLNVYDAGQGRNTSVTVNNLPTNGNSLYVRLFWWIKGVREFKDYTYTAASATAPAEMLTPVPGTTLSDSTVTFTWSAGRGVSTYWLWIGTAAGTHNVYDASLGKNTTTTINTLPTDGKPLYVRLFSWINGAWQYKDYTYTAVSTTAPAEMLTPAPGTAFSGPTATFTWSAGRGVSSYWLWIGTAPGTLNLYDANQGKNTSATVTNLPTNGKPIYVRLFSWINGSWQYRDYTYTAASATAPAEMLSPLSGTTLSGSEATFTWDAGRGVSSYWLWIGTAPGTLNLYDAGQGKNTSATINNLPTNGSMIYVRLFSWINGGWQYRDYVYVTSAQ